MKKITLLNILLISSLSYSYGQLETSFKGRLIDEETLLPVANATVSLINFSPPKKTITNAEGVFEIRGLPEGKHRVLMAASNYLEAEVGIELKGEKYLELTIAALKTDEETSIENKLKTKISTASTSYEQLLDAPATVYIITDHDIANRGYVYLSDVLEDIPEIEINDRVESDSYNQFTFRGITGNEKFLVLQDGIRITSGVNSLMPIDKNFPIRYAKRIEVLLGPASAIYGADAFLGVINIITEKGKHIQGGSASVAGGMFNTTDNQVQIGFGNYRHSFSMRGSFYRSSEPYLANFYQNADYDWYLNHYLPYGSVRTSPFGAPTDTTTIDILPYEGSRRAYSFDARWDFKNISVGVSRSNQLQTSALTNKAEFGPAMKGSVLGKSLTNVYVHHNLVAKKSARWMLSSTVQWNYFNFDPISKYKNVYSSYHDAYKYGFNHNFRWLENFTWNLHRNHHLSAGLQFQYTYALPKTSDLPFRYEPFQSAASQNFYYLGTNIMDADSHSLAIAQDFYFCTQVNMGGFLQYQFNFNDKLLVTAGGRLDYSALHDLKHQFDRKPYLSFNPRLGVVYKPMEHFRVKLFYGEAFLAPSPEKIFEHYGSFVPTQDSVGNNDGFISFFWRLPSIDVQPEKIRSAELQTFYTQKNYTLQLGGYFNYATNLVGEEIVLNQVFKGITVAGVEHIINNNRAMSYGGSARFEYSKPFGLLKKNTIKGYLSYSYSDGVISDSLRLYFSSQHIVKAGLHLTVRGFSVDTRLILRSPSFNDNEANQVANKTNALLNIYAQYRLAVGKEKNVQLAIFVRMRNALNLRYYSPAPYSISQFELAPQDPFRLAAGVSVSFNKTIHQLAKPVN